MGYIGAGITRFNTADELTVTGDAQIDTTTFVVDSTNNRVGIGETTPVTPLTIATTNKLGSTFTGTTNGEGLTVTQTDYTSGNYISLVEAAYDDSGDGSPNVRIGAMFDGGGSNLAFGTSNSYGSGITNTAMFIDSSGFVGIGTTSPAATQHTLSANAAISIQATTNSATGYHEYKYNTSTTAGYIGNGSGILSGANNSDFIVRSEADLVFNSNGNNERLRVLSGGGLTFNGDTAAANALSDYEEGTWTAGNASVTLTTDAGVYVKIGSLVYASAQIAYPTTSNTGDAHITGLPFNVKSGAANFSGNVSITDFGSDNLYAFTEAGGSRVLIRNNGNVNLTCANLSGKFLNFQLVYRTDS